MNRKLSDVIGNENFMQFYIKTLEAAKKYQFLVKMDEFIYHSKLQKAGFMHRDAFYHLSCAKASKNKPHECICFQLNLEGALRQVAELEYGSDFVNNL